MFSEGMLGFSIGASLHILQFWRKRLILTMPCPDISCMWKTTITWLEGQPLLHLLHSNLENDRRPMLKKDWTGPLPKRQPTKLALETQVLATLLRRRDTLEEEIYIIGFKSQLTNPSYEASEKGAREKKTNKTFDVTAFLTNDGWIKPCKTFGSFYLCWQKRLDAPGLQTQQHGDIWWFAKRIAACQDLVDIYVKCQIGLSCNVMWLENDIYNNPIISQ